MGQWVDFAEIRARVSLEDVLFRYYNVQGLKKQGTKLVGPCPVHGGSSPRAFHAELSKNVWHCFSKCRRGGNQLDFVAAKEGISIRDAALKLKEYFLGSDDEPETESEEPAPPKKEGTRPKKRRESASSAGDEPAEPERNRPLEVTLQLAGDHPHLARDRGLASETIEHFGVGYCSRGIMRGCIAIPIHDEDGTLVAYAGRRLKPKSIDEHGKYKLPKGFRKELVLYNLHRAREVEMGLILVEGFFSVMALHEAGFTNAVASMGCEVSDAQVALLAEAADVIVLFDGNEAGWSGAETVREKLAGKVPVRVIRLPQDTEPEDLPPRALRWLVNGMRSIDLAEVSFSFQSTSADTES